MTQALQALREKRDAAKRECEAAREVASKAREKCDATRRALRDAEREYTRAVAEAFALTQNGLSEVSLPEW